MTTAERDFSTSEHDWHSDAYVAWWIGRDATGREAVRRERLRAMLALAPFDAGAEIAILDVGGGYGLLTEEVLAVFPQCRVALQDYSQPMLDAAKERLVHAAGRVDYVQSDLRDTGWIDSAGGPFDLAVSSIAIHNLREIALIGACYRGVLRLLKPGGLFLDYDIFGIAGGIETHTRLMRAAGFGRIECPWQEAPAAILAAYASGT